MNDARVTLRRKLVLNGNAVLKHQQGKSEVKMPFSVLAGGLVRDGLSQLGLLFSVPQARQTCNHNTPDRFNTVWRGRELCCSSCGKQIQIGKKQMDYVLHGKGESAPSLFSAASTGTMVYAAAALTGSWLIMELCSLFGSGTSSSLPSFSPGLQYANDFFAMYSNGIVFTLMQKFVHGRSILMSALDCSLSVMLIYMVASLVYFASRVEKSERPRALVQLYLSLALLMLMFPVPLISWLQHHVKPTR
ncbi:MAG: hypothetical protein K2W95_08810 [Candidatus Obscuribacterales bacterium]|nr:hypothetical protein [Candidatus Obscuribacterales bacterium]